MTKSRCALLMGLIVLGAAAPAAAQYNQDYFASVIGTGNQMANGVVAVRYYAPTDPQHRVSPGGGWDSCPFASTGATTTWNPDNFSCELRFLPAGGGYRGYLDNLFNDLQNGQDHYAVFDFESGGGTAQHIGYYFWGRRTVNNGGDPLSGWAASNCVGTLAATCLAQGNNATSTGYTLNNTPLGTLQPLGGLRPIPVPIIGAVTKDPSPGTDAAMVVNWFVEARGWSLTGGGAGAEFGAGQARYLVAGLAKAIRTTPTIHCEKPAPAEFDAALPGDVNHFYPTQTGTTLTAHVSDFGRANTDAFCYYFALKIVYDDANFTPAITSLHYSANSNAVVFGGLASGMTNMSATVNKGKIVTVNWTTTLAECVQGYNVLRSLNPAGPFIQVNRALIPDKHSPAKYSYIDVLKTPVRNLWYMVEAISCDQSTDRTPAFEAKK